MTAEFPELSDWVAPNEQQAVLQQDFLTHIYQHDRPASRWCLPDHLTASALVINDTGTHVLLGLHRKVGLWLQFGGHVELDDPSLSSAALREAQEESGLDSVDLVCREPIQLDRHRAPCSPRARHHLDVQYLAVASLADQPQVSTESLDVRWFAAEELPTPTDAAVRSLVATALSASRQLGARQSVRPPD